MGEMLDPESSPSRKTHAPVLALRVGRGVVFPTLSPLEAGAQNAHRRSVNVDRHLVGRGGYSVIEHPY